jgi:hypothetical protein
MSIEDNIEHFFWTARQRYNIKLQREAGVPPPWTGDPQFKQWRFCNVHREDDKTTRWFRDHVRDKTTNLKNLESTVIFRWFNKIETGEIIEDLLTGEWNTNEARRRLKDVKPVVTGAYIIKGMDGFNKLDGVLYVIDEALQELPHIYETWVDLAHGSGIKPTLQRAWSDLRELHYLGNFMAYEVVSDIRWSILEDAPDIMDWANAGPGAARGLRWIYQEEFNKNSAADQKRMNVLMQELLERSYDFSYWPSEWKHWEMREVEHWLCEYDKYMRAARGDSMKRRFRP